MESKTIAAVTIATAVTMRMTFAYVIIHSGMGHAGQGGGNGHKSDEEGQCLQKMAKLIPKV